jgi:5-formyltetrahydrofolate cyclo-ligase
VAPSDLIHADAPSHGCIQPALIAIPVQSASTLWRTQPVSHPDSPDPERLAEAKRALRALATERRRQLAAEVGPAEAGAAAAEQFLSAIKLKRGTAISGYWPLEGEFDPRPLMERLVERGHPVGLPVVIGRDRPLQFRDWRPGIALVPGPFRVPTPPPDSPLLEPRVLLVPMLAFDREGYRLGYGGGYYDRTLALLRARGRALAVGTAFDGQEVAHVPHADFDQPLDWIVTERRALRVGAN